MGFAVATDITDNGVGVDVDVDDGVAVVWFNLPLINTAPVTNWVVRASLVVTNNDDNNNNNNDDDGVDDIIVISKGVPTLVGGLKKGVAYTFNAAAEKYVVRLLL
jgi:hypothetical protein